EQELSMIISDQRMPGMVGTELLEKTIATHPDAIRIIVSGYSDLGAVLNAINQAKIYHFITKPFESTDFLLIVQQALNVSDFKKDIKNELSSLKKQLGDCTSVRQKQQQQLTEALAKLAAQQH
ncbi:MAG: DNA-binding NtrC family response regulator, partial [Phenylobacterium sp.]